MTSIFTKSVFGFSENKLNNNYYGRDIDLPITNSHFGFIELQVASTPATSEIQELVCVIDQSGSMSDPCKDDRTKMQHIIYTLKNIIYYFIDNPEVNVFMSIYSFDDSFHIILERTKIDKKDLQMMLNNIDKLRPRGNTNIENALIRVKEVIGQLQVDFPTHTVNHLFMTDGEANIGNTDKNILKGLVVNMGVQNAFIGFGDNHDSHLLNYLASVPASSYYFIDALENSGLVYGEILNNIIYKLLSSVQIETQNCLIYDFKTNTWCQKMVIGDIAGEANKKFHIVSSSPLDCSISLKGNFNNNYVISFELNKISVMETDIQKYIFRQKTLQLLFKSNELCETQKIPNNGVDGWFNNNCNNDKEDTEEYKKHKYLLRQFFEELKKYMRDNGLEEDNFYKNLCDDIYICYRTFGTRYGGMYSVARQTSQGNQRCYTVSNVPDDDYDYDISTEIFTLNLPINNNNNNNNNNLSHELSHDISQFNDTPYLTPKALRLMRDISINRDDV